MCDGPGSHPFLPKTIQFTLIWVPVPPQLTLYVPPNQNKSIYRYKLVYSYLYMQQLQSSKEKKDPVGVGDGKGW